MDTQRKTNMENTPTPRTDAATFHLKEYPHVTGFVSVDFARRLERELAQVLDMSAQRLEVMKSQQNPAGCDGDELSIRDKVKKLEAAIINIVEQVITMNNSADSEYHLPKLAGLELYVLTERCKKAMKLITRTAGEVPIATESVDQEGGAR